jgi:hypothetical protein
LPGRAGNISTPRVHARIVEAQGPAKTPGLPRGGDELCRKKHGPNLAFQQGGFDPEPLTYLERVGQNGAATPNGSGKQFGYGTPQSDQVVATVLDGAKYDWMLAKAFKSLYENVWRKLKAIRADDDRWCCSFAGALLEDRSRATAHVALGLSSGGTSVM